MEPNSLHGSTDVTGRFPTYRLLSPETLNGVEIQRAGFLKEESIINIAGRDFEYYFFFFFEFSLICNTSAYSVDLHAFPE